MEEYSEGELERKLEKLHVKIAENERTLSEKRSLILDMERKIEHNRQTQISLASANYDSAQSSAHHYMSIRDEFTSKVRFGIIGLNGGSGLAVITILGSIESKLAGFGIGTSTILWSALGFSLGVLTGGLALLVHQNHLVSVSGSAIARAINLRTAVSLLYWGNDDALDKAHKIITEGAKDAPETAFSSWGNNLQYASASCWLYGATNLAVSVALHFIR